MKINFHNIIIPLEREKIITTLTKFLQCKICMNILNNPYDCQCCNQTFCKDCISNYIKTNKKCPYEDFYSNNSNSNKTIISRLNNLKSSSANFSNVLNSLRFQCQFKKNGCDKILCLEEITQHEKKCRYSKNKNDNNSIKKSSDEIYLNCKNNFEDMENLNVNEIMRHQDSCVSFHNIDDKFINNNNSQNTDNYPTTINTTINNDSLDKIEQSLIQINSKLESFINEINENDPQKKIMRLNTAKEKEINKLFVKRLKKNDNNSKNIIKTETNSERSFIAPNDNTSYINSERESIKEYFSNYPQTFRHSTRLPIRKNEMQNTKNEIQSKIVKKNTITNIKKNVIKVKMKNKKQQKKIKLNSNDVCNNNIDNNSIFKNVVSNIIISNSGNNLRTNTNNAINKSITNDSNLTINSNKNFINNENIIKKEKYRYSVNYLNVDDLLSDKETENSFDIEEFYSNIIKISKRINNIENLLNSKDSFISLNEKKNELINDNIKKINQECNDLKKENNLLKKYIKKCTDNILEKMNIKISNKLSELKNFLSEKNIEDIKEYVINLNKDLSNLYIEKFDNLMKQINDL